MIFLQALVLVRKLFRPPLNPLLEQGGDTGVVDLEFYSLA